jgi:hypothetical protein
MEASTTCCIWGPSPRRARAPDWGATSSRPSCICRAGVRALALARARGLSLVALALAVTGTTLLWDGGPRWQLLLLIYLPPLPAQPWAASPPAPPRARSAGPSARPLGATSAHRTPRLGQDRARNRSNQLRTWAYPRPWRASRAAAARRQTALCTPDRLHALHHRLGHDGKPLRAVPDRSEAVSERPVLARTRDHGPKACRAQHLVAANRVYVRAPQLEPSPGGRSCPRASRLLESRRRGTRVRLTHGCVIRRQHRRGTLTGGQKRPLPWASLGRSDRGTPN